MTTSSKGTHSTSGMARLAHFPSTFEGIVIDARDRFHGRRPRLGNRFPSSGPARPCFWSLFSLDRAIHVDSFLSITRDRLNVAQDHDSLGAHSDERVSSTRSLSLFQRIPDDSRDLHLSRSALLQCAVIFLDKVNSDKIWPSYQVCKQMIKFVQIFFIFNFCLQAG